MFACIILRDSLGLFSVRHVRGHLVSTSNLIQLNLLFGRFNNSGLKGDRTAASSNGSAEQEDGLCHVTLTGCDLREWKGQWVDVLTGCVQLFVDLKVMS